MMQTVAWLNTAVQAIGGKSVLARNLWICSALLVALALAEGGFLFLKGKWSALAAESTARRIRDR